MLDGLTHVVYVASRMKVRATIGRVGKARGAIAQVGFSVLSLCLLLQFIGQPELDNRQPLFRARSLGAQIFKQQHTTKSGLAHGQQLYLAATNRVLTLGYDSTFVRNAGQPNLVRTPLLSIRSIRSPPRTAAA